MTGKNAELEALQNVAEAGADQPPRGELSLFIPATPEEERLAKECGAMARALTRNRQLYEDEDSSAEIRALAAHCLGRLHEKLAASPSLAASFPEIAAGHLADAYGWHKAAYSLGHVESGFKLALFRLEGRGPAIRNFARAFKLFQKLAFRGHAPSMRELGKCYAKGLGTEKSAAEAYVWDLLSRSVGKAVAELESILGRKAVHAAQSEAEARQAILDDPALDDKKKHKLLREREFILDTPQKPAAPPAPRKEAPDPFADWEVADIKKLRIDLNPKEKNIVVRYGRRSARFAFGEVFNACDLALMTDFCRHELDPREPRIAYDRNDFSLSRAFKRKRNNQGVVSDLNHKIRRLFRLDRGVKPFYWFGERGSRDKVLRTSLRIRVHW